MRSKRNLLRYDGRFCVAVRLFACLFLTNFALIPGHSWTFRMSQDLSGSVYFDKLVSCGFPVTENLWHVTLQWFAVRQFFNTKREMKTIIFFFTENTPALYMS